MSERITIRCPNCHERFSAETDALAGVADPVTCPGCGDTFVPGSDLLDEALRNTGGRRAEMLRSLTDLFRKVGRLR